MGRFTEPIRGTRTLRLNNTLHGRSIHRKKDVPGHNVFKGYNAPGTGDAIDLFDEAGSPVFAIADGTITRWANDASRLEVIYVEGVTEGIRWCCVYAHVNAAVEGVGKAVKKGQKIGTLRGDLKDPHLHIELWINGKALHGSTAAILRKRMVAALGLDG